ncbi:MAG: alpha-amylase family glycosyl hydrolase [Pirellulales bacterium]
MSSHTWWNEAVIYEVFVPSFQDSNGDGIGDLAGVTQRLDYLCDLGVGGIWLSPIYKTEFFDAGYDVIDHREIDTRFGTMQDFRELLRQAKSRGLRVILDFIPNHTSHCHRWFEESRSSRENLKRDWYLWSSGSTDGGPPNNWINRYGRSAWTFDAATGQYYFATFAPEQPDLNWRNPHVREAMWEILRFWLDEGIDGVRVDAMSHLLKDRLLRNNPVQIGYRDEQEPSNKLDPCFSQNQPELLEVISELKNVLDEFEGRVFAGEVYQVPEQISAYQRAGADVLLNVSLLQSPFHAGQVMQTLARCEAQTPLDHLPAYAAGSHDIPRLASRVPAELLRIAMLLQLAVRGVPTIYYGDEIGMPNAQVLPEHMVDPSGRDDARYSRDLFRAPMLWDRSHCFGFSSSIPYLKADHDSEVTSVADQSDDSASHLTLVRRLLKLRNQERVLRCGRYIPLDVSADMAAFERSDGEECLLVVLNFSERSQTFLPPRPVAERLLSTLDDVDTDQLRGSRSEVRSSDESETMTTRPGAILMRPYEGMVFRVA